MPLLEVGAPIPAFLLFHCFQHPGAKRCLFFDYIPTHPHDPREMFMEFHFAEGAYDCNILISRWLNGLVFGLWFFCFMPRLYRAG